MSLPFIPVSLERLQENSVRGLQEERESHKGGPWRQDPRADFIVGLGIRSAYGHLTNHAEILAMEYGELISRLAEVRKQLAELNADSTIPRAYDKRINVLFGHIYHEDITGPAQENAVGIMADRASAFSYEAVQCLLADILPELEAACRAGNTGMGFSLGIRVFSQPDQEWADRVETETPCYTVVPDPE
jgi:hypothetical protein